jgi:hypothetical protein
MKLIQQIKNFFEAQKLIHRYGVAIELKKFTA